MGQPLSLGSGALRAPAGSTPAAFGRGAGGSGAYGPLRESAFTRYQRPAAWGAVPQPPGQRPGRRFPQALSLCLSRRFPQPRSARRFPQAAGRRPAAASRIAWGDRGSPMGLPLSPQAMPHSGTIFWFSRNRFPGSYVRLSAASRA